MHLTEILIEKEALDLYTDKALKYRLQVNSIASPKDRECSFLNATNIPKTAKNTRLLMGLGLPSDLSRIPYLKPNCELRMDGYNFISKGWIGIEETGEDYKIRIYSGIIQFFKSIEGKTIGNDLNLSEINHEKNLANVYNSFFSPYYRYMLGDYNGKQYFGSNDEKINIDYLVPSVSVAYLWDKIHSTYGFTYSGVIFDSSLFNNLWITYPKPIELGEEVEQISIQKTDEYHYRTTSPSFPDSYYNQFTAPNLGNQNRAFVAQTKGNYRIKIHVKNSSAGVKSMGMWYSINSIGLPFMTRTNTHTVASNDLNPFAIWDHSKVIQLNAGDEVDFYTMQFFDEVNKVAIWVQEIDIKITRITETGADFSEELKDFAITDFVKDILNQTGLTPFSNEYDNNIDYKLITERFATAEVMDWSNKYVRRKSEKYVYETFAQQNYFRYQYNDKESNYNDGTLEIQNLNLAEKKDLFKSKMYSPEQLLIDFQIGTKKYPMRVFKMYDKTIKEKNGQTTIEYKSLSKRFHYVRSVAVTDNIIIGSESIENETNVSAFTIVDYTSLTWNEILSIYYPLMANMLVDSRVHDIELNLNATDVILLDQSKMVYFEQEQQYYVIDSLDYDGDEIANGKFIRVRRDKNAIVLPPDDLKPDLYTITLIWDDFTNTPKSGNLSTIRINNSAFGGPTEDDLTKRTFQAFINGQWRNVKEASTQYEAPLIYGVNKFRMKGLTQNGKTYFSNILQYTKTGV